MSSESYELFDLETRKNVKHWIEGDCDAETKKEIKRLLKEDPVELVSAFHKMLTFGTGGIRGLMGVGPNRLNRYTMRQIAQGIANKVKKCPKEKNVGKDKKKHSVLIGYDSRRHSRSFAEEAAKVFAGNGIEVLLFSEMKPTPLVSYGCRMKHCTAAMMITGSHNAAGYNGCKIYGREGAQVSAPEDQQIIDEIQGAMESGNIVAVPTLDHPLIVEIQGEIDAFYVEMSSHLQNYRDENQKYGNELKIVYTSFHGTGITLLPKVFSRWGFQNLHCVKEQVIPDGNFPTLSYPNPEEKEALLLGIEMLESVDGDVLIATDPDADRVGVAVKHKGKTEHIKGNQIAALLLDHLCNALAAKNTLAANGAVIKTFVTTELFQAIADYYQKPCFNVLPSFKYVMEKVGNWEMDCRGRRLIFAGEGACGYLFGSEVRDKDGIGAAALIAEMALHWKLRGKTLVDMLHALYRRHGFYHEVVRSIHFAESREAFALMMTNMESLRHLPPANIAGIRVCVMEDYERLIKNDFQNHVSHPLNFPKFNMLVFWLADRSRIVVRPSGTEPKIKIYCEVVCKTFDSIESATQMAQERSENLIAHIKRYFD